MANSIYSNLFVHNGGYGNQALNRLQTGNPTIQPFLPVLYRVRFDFNDILAAAATKTLVLNTHAGAGKEFPANVLVEDVWGYVHTLFDGGTTTDLTIQLGDTGDPNGFTTALSIHADGAGVLGWQQFTRGVQAAGTLTARPEAAYEPNALLTATAGDTDELTAGNMSLFYKIVPIQVPASS